MDAKTNPQSRIDLGRRMMLTGVGVGLSGLAGCGAEEASIDTGTQLSETQLSTTVGQETETQTATPEFEVGGWPTIGGPQAPDSLNPLVGTHRLIEETLHTFGSILHPLTLEPLPWGYEDWEVRVSNVGTSSPTLIGYLRDDISFHDGKQVTAEDVKFTVEYITEQEVAGRYSASKFDSVESVSVDHPKGTTVNYFLSEEDAGWFQNIFGQIFLPKHVWKHVEDYQQYAPRTTSEGVVGAGPFELKEFNWENWFELEIRDEDDRWETAASYSDWFHDDAPFVDGIRFELFGSEDRTRQALFDGDIAAAFQSVPVGQAVKATERDELTVKQTPSAGWANHSYNTRRIPMDDRAFRQFLVLTVDKEWIVEELNKGIGAAKGTYATPKLYEDWRPPEPHEQSEFRGIPTPTLEFPGVSGDFTLDAEGLATARRFLTEHTEAQYEYTFEVAENEQVTSADNKVLHIDGTPFGEAHTDNDEQRGQGPLAVSLNPPGEDLDEARVGQQWVEILRQIGVPAEPKIQSFASQVSNAFAKEEFDVVAINWNSLPITNTHYPLLFGSEGADLEGDVDVPMLNAMGYTGADELINKQKTMMDIEQRKPIVKQILATIWHDAPTNVLNHATLLQPVDSQWEGWIETIGGVINVHSLLNLRRRK